MSLPPGFLEELRTRLQVSDVVGKRVPLQRSTKGEFKACCPFHKEKTPSFTVNDQKGFFYCFGCGATGDVISFVMQHDRLSFMEAIETLASQAGLEVPKAAPEDRAKFERQKTLYDVVESACAFFEAELRGPGGRAARDYLKGRGLDGETVSRFRLGFAPGEAGKLIKHLRSQGFQDAMIEEVGLARRPDDGRDLYSFFRNRVMFPVADKRGRTVAFGGRIMEGDGPKYINSPDNPLFHKGNLLYGMSRARQAASQGQTVIVAEGYMDVIALVRAGFEAAVAPLGTALTEEQIAELWKMAPVPVLCFDGDEAGRRAAWRAMDRITPQLKPDHSARIAFLPQGEDPDSLIRGSGGGAAMQAVLEGALPLVRVLYDRQTTMHRLETPEGRAGLRAGVEAQARRIADPAVQGQYLAELRARFEEAFPWRPKRQGGGEWRPGGKPPQPAGPKPQSIRDEQDDRLPFCVLLCLLAAHPGLGEEVGEGFAMLEIPDSGLESVRQSLLARLGDSHGRDLGHDSDGLDSQPTAPYLTVPEADGLPPALVDRIRRKWPFTRPEAPLEEARAGWAMVMGHLELRALRREFADAARDLARQGTEAALERWRGLRQEIERRQAVPGGF
ncbi:DNA primase [Inquilinus limosus]|uniref:DNA primase n=1 Tax=Inquilinus limosus TaxID=171674 RepID=A0A211ZFT7_9PROT|nr:DNA primase [Inquilinus limosus]OWJ63987.1 DNA primase [Inquilinus limosus]